MLAGANPFAVIDIGSNSVRMVVYHALDRVPMPLFNEKYYCGLAQGLQTTGKLSPDGVALAHQALARFTLMLERFHIKRALVIATAAIRDAKDGKAFVKELQKRHGLKVKVIDGEREATLAGLGIMGSMWQPEGLCADLGGGSLELALIECGAVTHIHSLPLGALRLLGQFGGATDKMHAHVRAELASIKWLSKARVSSCYAIGGGFRSIAKLHVRQSESPLKLVHEYAMDSASLKQVHKEVCALDETQIAALPGISAKRAATLPIATSVLNMLLDLSGAKRSIFSVAGIREGLAHEQLSAKERRADPLLASARVLSTIAGRKGRYAKELFGWMQPLFANEPKTHARLRLAFCQISEIAWTIDPNFRAEWSFLRIMQSDMKGLNHPERVMLALALYHRYQVKLKKDYAELSLLSDAQKQWAQMVGIAANLAFQLSGGQAGNLHHAQLTIDAENTPAIKLDKTAKALYTEVVEKRLEGLGVAVSALSSNAK
jgi:exopolyphosphatase/guanosine-5'-triphosphate,3'-diphosphate pyrophosphatase